MGIGTSRFVLYREVFFIQSVLYRRFHCISQNNGGRLMSKTMAGNASRTIDIIIIQWNLRISDTFVTSRFVLYKEVVLSLEVKMYLL